MADDCANADPPVEAEANESARETDVADAEEALKGLDCTTELAEPAPAEALTPEAKTTKAAEADPPSDAEAEAAA